MPSWKRVIVSGSNATLNSLTVSNGITGSLFGTASWAVSASWAPVATTAATASFVTASNVFGPFGSNSILSSSFATNASSASVTDTTTGVGPYYVMFADGTTGNRVVRVDSNNLTFNATTNTLTVANLAGTASWANNAATASYVNPLNQDVVISGSLTQGSGSSALNFSHAEGIATVASGSYSHAEGQYTSASGQYSHAEGGSTSAAGIASHAEGSSTLASGLASHAEGGNTQALGNYSHAEGLGTVSQGAYQHVQGVYNLSSSVSYAFIHGNGTGNANRSNLIYAVGSVVQITGSLKVTGSITGSIFGTSSWAVSASWAPVATTAATASFVTASNVYGPFGSNSILSSSFAQTASFAPLYLPLTGGTITGNVTVNGTASIGFLNVQYESASVIYSSGSNVFGDATNDTQTLNGTVLVSGSQQITGSLNVTRGITGSLFGTASYATQALSASYYGGSVATASYALTSSNVQGGTANYIPLWNTATSLSSSAIYQSAGNVGIGTTAPLSKFHVRATADQNFRVSSGTTLEVNSINDADSAYTPVTFRASSFNFANGNVGIGTTSPTVRLDVSGSVNVRSAAPTITFDRNSSYTWRLVNGDGGTYPTSTFNVANNAGTSVATFLDSGNVGIGTTTPNAKLDVNGNTIITGSLAVSQSLLQYSNITAVTSGSTSNVASFNTSSYTAAFFDYVTTSGTNARAGSVFTVWNGNSVEYAETLTNDIGSTSNLLLSASVSAGAVRLQATSLSGSWSVKTLARML